MRRFLLLAAVAAAAAGCVSVDGPPDPHGALKPGQRVVVAVYPSPGPWIIGSSDSKAEAASKITPLGFLVQTAEDQHTLTVSKNLQQYLPRPHLGLAMQESLMKALRAARSTDTVTQTAMEAGISELQLAEWNKSKDQLDWRERYYAPDPDSPPRDYARVMTLDDALILDANVSFGTDANDDGIVLPQMRAAVRVYRGDTSHLLWEHEEIVTDKSSSSTLTDFQVSPVSLTDSLQKLAPALGAAVANSFLNAVTMAPSTSSVQMPTPHPIASGGGGLVSMSAFKNFDSTSAPAGAMLLPSAMPRFSPSAMPVAATGVPTISSTAATSPAAPSSAIASPASTPPAASAIPASVSTPTVSSLAISTSAVSSLAASSGTIASPAGTPPVAIPAAPVSVSTPAASPSTPTTPP